MWHLVPSESRQALETCERFADGMGSREELLQARRLAAEGYRRVNQQLSFKKRTVRPPARAALVVAAVADDPWEAAGEAVRASIDLFGSQPLDLMGCVFGDPFH